MWVIPANAVTPGAILIRQSGARARTNAWRKRSSVVTYCLRHQYFVQAHKNVLGNIRSVVSWSTWSNAHMRTSVLQRIQLPSASNQILTKNAQWVKDSALAMEYADMRNYLARNKNLVKLLLFNSQTLLANLHQTPLQIPWTPALVS